MSSVNFEWYRQIVDWIWKDDLRSLNAVDRWLKLPMRMLIVLARDMLDGQLSLRAASLVYTTLLSIVPLLAVSFSVLKGFGVHNELEPLLNNFLEPLGEEGLELSANIIGSVDSVKVGVLGSIGLAFLLYTVVSLIQKVESAFNYAWRVERLRAFAQRISSYLSAILVGPVLVFSALGLTATIMNNTLVQGVMSIEPFGHVIASGSKLMPYLLIIAAFTFVYILIPNTRVRILPALAGGVLAGILWQTTGWGFAVFIASSSRYAAIYSGFAILILLLIWLYLNWLILLLGAKVTFYVQYPQYLTRYPVRPLLSNRLRETLALHLMFMIAERYLHKRDPWSLEEFVQHIGLPTQPVHHVLRILQEAGFVSETSDEPPGYLPRRDIDTIGLSELLLVVRRAGENRLLTFYQPPRQAEVEAVMQDMQQAMEAGMGEQTLKDMVVPTRYTKTADTTEG